MNNKTIGRIVVISLTTILVSLTYLLGLPNAILATLIVITILVATALALATFILFVGYLHYLFGNNIYRNFDEYVFDRK